MAVLGSVLATAVGDAHGGPDPRAAFTDGLADASWAGVAVALVGVLTAWLRLPGRVPDAAATAPPAVPDLDR